MKCKNCNYDLESYHVHFCPNCGEHVPKEEKHYPGEPFDDKMEHTGKYRLPKAGEYYMLDFVWLLATSNHGKEDREYWILQPLGTHEKWLRNHDKCKEKKCDNCGNESVCCFNNPCEYVPKTPEPVTTVTVWIPNIAPLYQYIADKCNGCETFSASGVYFFKGTYSFTGLPNIGQIIDDTLSRDALAVNVECNQGFYYVATRTTKHLLMWKKDVGRINGDIGWFRLNKSFDGICFWHNGGEDKKTDAQIERAIRSYIKKQKEHEQEIKKGEPVIWRKKLHTFISSSDKYCNIEDVEGITITVPKVAIRKASPDEVLEYFTVDVDGNRFIAYTSPGLITLRMLSEDGIKHSWLSGNGQRDSVVTDTFIKHNDMNLVPMKIWNKLFDGEMPYPKKRGE